MKGVRERKREDGKEVELIEKRSSDYLLLDISVFLQ